MAVCRQTGHTRTTPSLHHFYSFRGYAEISGNSIVQLKKRKDVTIGVITCVHIFTETVIAVFLLARMISLFWCTMLYKKKHKKNHKSNQRVGLTPTLLLPPVLRKVILLKKKEIIQLLCQVMNLSNLGCIIG